MRNAAVAGLSLLVAGNALLRGGVDLPLVAASAAVAALAALLATVHRHDVTHLRVPVLVLALAAGGLATAGQVLPLPPFALRALSPAANALFQDALGPLGLYPAFRPLSLDPGATALELAKAAAWVLAALAAGLLAARREHRDRILAAVALSGAAVGACVYLGALAGLAPLLEPRRPFVNPNHLAGFLQVTAWPALGFALRARGRARAGWLLAFAFAASGVFLSLSRAGIAAFFVGAGLFAILAARARAPGRRRAATAVAAGAVSLALALAAWLALGPVVEEMGTLSDSATTETKLGLWPRAAAMIREHPVAGIGLGAFATAFPAYKSEPSRVTFTHVENEWLQLPLDLGLPVGLGLLAAFAWTWLAAARPRERAPGQEEPESGTGLGGPLLSRPVAGALAGAGALAAHNLFDFSLEISGVALPFVVVMGAVAAEGRTVPVRPWLLRAGAVALAGLAAVGLAVHRAHPTDADAARVASAPTADEAVARARAALHWHPADWVPPAAAGVKLAAEGRCAEAMPWLERAMLRSPTSPEPHRAAAGCLARGGRHDQARGEYRLAFLFGDPDALREARAVYDGPGAFLDLAPRTPAGLLAAGALLSDRPAEAREAYRRALDLGETGALPPLAEATLRAGDPGGALGVARRARELLPMDPRPIAIAARALEALGDAEGALRELEEGAERFPGHPLVLVPLGSRHLQARRFSQAKGVFEDIVAREGPALARKKVLVARALEGQERWAEALRELRGARDTAPDDLGALEAYARVAAAAGRLDEAIEALEVASGKPGARPGAYEAQLAAMRARRDASRIERLTQPPAGP
jgi:tetratricopeptide (TPR) repeat protein